MFHVFTKDPTERYQGEKDLEVYFLCRLVYSFCRLADLSWRLVYVVLSSQGCHLEPGATDFPPLLREWPPATFIGNRRKTGPKEIPSHLIPHLLVVFTRQLV